MLGKAQSANYLTIFVSNYHIHFVSSWYGIPTCPFNPIMQCIVLYPKTPAAMLKPLDIYTKQPASPSKPDAMPANGIYATLRLPYKRADPFKCNLRNNADSPRTKEIPPRLYYNKSSTHPILSLLSSVMRAYSRSNRRT